MTQEAIILVNLLELWYGNDSKGYFDSQYYDSQYYDVGGDGLLALCSGPTATVNVESYDWDDLTSSTARDYIPFGFKVGALSRSVEQMTPILAIDVALTGDLLTLLGSNDIRGMTVVLKSYEYGVALDDPDNVDLIYIGKIEEWAEKDLVVVLTCKDSTINYWMKNPKRQYSYQCGHPFKRYKCAYAGAETYCAKTLTVCTAYGNDEKYGGFPEIWRQMRSVI